MGTLSAVRTVRLATRPSPLALAQAAIVAGAVRGAAAHHLELATEIVATRTAGDVDRRELTEIGGTGVFVGAVRRAVLDGRADVAVHSAKDLPVAPAAGLVLAAIPTRGDVGDVLVVRVPTEPAARAGAGTESDGAAAATGSDGAAAAARTLLAGLPAGARIGTGSPRRAAALAAAGRSAGVPVEVVGVRGNVGTRVALVADGRLDAVVVAAAGLDRLDAATPPPGLEFRRCPLEWMLPAPAQGALALECRADAPPWLQAVLHDCSDEATRVAVEAERSVLEALDAGCSTPVGTLARLDDTGGVLHLLTSLARPDGRVVTASVRGPAAEPRALGAAAARALLGDVARSATPGPPVPHLSSDLEEGAS